MTYQPVTVRLPDQLYERVRQRAQARNRSLESELIQVVQTGLDIDDEEHDIASEIESELTQLPFLADDDLWRAAQLTIPVATSERMEELLWKSKAEGLTHAEREEAERLQFLGQRVMLIRAEAAVLLKNRGFDISILKPRYE